MRNSKLQSMNKLQNAIVAVDRQISKCERELRCCERGSRSYEQHERELFSLRQKRSKLYKGLSHR